MELQQRLPLAVLKRFINNVRNDPAIRLQQRLPLAVLKRFINNVRNDPAIRLQQRLPLAVLKPFKPRFNANVLTAGCNSAYRLRY